MPTRRTTEEQRHKLKAAVRRQIGLLGGVDAVEELSRVRHQMHSNYAGIGEDQRDFHMPIDIVMDLSLEAIHAGGRPEILDELADHCGFNLCRKKHLRTDASPKELTADFLVHGSELNRDMVLAMADQVISTEEHALLRPQAVALRQLVDDIIHALDAGVQQSAAQEQSAQKIVEIKR
ncbi:hypothetical protein [Roseibium sp. RKSG952]|uniref:hypothetical protein n=1 Tax=Roseibium sp. RKSG952 TaxID=2529384 RepID=UPI0012BBE10E|nr:hypothetical protein [Roseibium sp. RKSG952]MTH96557.1 hypothetical protein [Roseibium sp. RKSG952]